ncbi:MAG TPA: ACT domain-containing protein [Bryobacteraceae bacterium]
MDRVVMETARDLLQDRLPAPFALVAVGGYGRRELFPYSDVDLLLVLEHEPSENLKEPLSQFLRTLWDSSVKASHSVRTIDECCRVHENNIHLSISLLDARFLTGSPWIFDELQARLADFFHRQATPLLRGLANLTSARHNKFGNTVYHLEPNIKEGPGGIRDVHFVEWAAKLGPDKEPLRHAAAGLGTARDFLYRVRYFLHEQAGRDNNLLSFELQDRAAETLPCEAMTPEEWMRIVYRHLKTCFQAGQQTLDFIARSETGLARQFRDWRGRLSTADYTVAQNRIFLRNPATTLVSLAAVFDLFRFVARQGIRLSWDTQRRVRERASALVAEPPLWPAWRSLLSEPHASLALREMEDAGILAAALPSWGTVESLVVRDFYHRYTVDEHTLVAIGAIDLLLSNASDATPRFRDLAREEDQLALVRMSLLLHDIGKGTEPGNHVRGSIEEADRFLSSIGTPAAERESITFLIAHHLDLSLVMNGRDLSDPATARFLSSQIGTYEDLRRLTLLTYADISAVNPSAMTPWRVEQLWRVHSVAAAQLTRELASDRIHSENTARDRMRPDLAHFLEGFPARYARIHTSQRIEEHFRLEQIRLHAGVALEIQSEPGAYVLTVLAADHPGLFAALCGTLASFGMNIVKAEAASNAVGSVLDEFRFTDPARTLELNPEEIERLRWTTECVVKGAIEVRDLLKRRRATPRPHASAQSTASVRFDDTASDSATLLNFAANDRPGLLFELARVLTESGCNIEVVLVNTEGHRALDALYVTKDGEKLDSATEARLEPLLRAL